MEDDVVCRDEGLKLVVVMRMVEVEAQVEAQVPAFWLRSSGNGAITPRKPGNDWTGDCNRRMPHCGTTTSPTTWHSSLSHVAHAQAARHGIAREVAACYNHQTVLASKRGLRLVPDNGLNMEASLPAVYQGPKEGRYCQMLDTLLEMLLQALVCGSVPELLRISCRCLHPRLR